MPDDHRPRLSLPYDREPVDSFVRNLQRALDELDADRFNAQFAADVLWGSPFGALGAGYETIHAIHSRMFAQAAERAASMSGEVMSATSRYSVEQACFVADGVALAYVRRTNTQLSGEALPGRAGAFDELALFVLVKRDDRWWLAAAQHVPDRRDVYASP